MIIQCPACSTKYVVPDAAIGVEGRTVRCAKCRHSWYQDGPELDLADLPTQEAKAPPPQPEAPPEPESAPPPPPPPEPEPDPEPDTGPGAEPDVDDSAEARGEPELPPEPENRIDRIRPAEDVPPPPVEKVYGDDEQSHFDHEPPFRPRRNPLKLWTWAAGIFAIVAAALVFAVSYWGLPDWVPVDRPTFAAGNADLQIDFPRDQQELRTLPNGTVFFGASGTITNIGTETQTIPTLLIVMRDSRDTIVYSWEVPAPQRTIAPGETVTVNEAVTDVPRRATGVQIGWKPE